MTASIELYCALVGAVGVVFALLMAAAVKGAPAGDEKMNEIAGAVKEGAIAYLNRQLKTVFIAAAVIVVSAERAKGSRVSGRFATACARCSTSS